jgi:hypothetical protein
VADHRNGTVTAPKWPLTHLTTAHALALIGFVIALLLVIKP